MNISPSSRFPKVYKTQLHSTPDRFALAKSESLVCPLFPTWTVILASLLPSSVFLFRLRELPPAERVSQYLPGVLRNSLRRSSSSMGFLPRPCRFPVLRFPAWPRLAPRCYLKPLRCATRRDLVRISGLISYVEPEGCCYRATEPAPAEGGGERIISDARLLFQKSTASTTSSPRSSS